MEQTAKPRGLYSVEKGGTGVVRTGRYKAMVRPGPQPKAVSASVVLLQMGVWVSVYGQSYYQKPSRHLCSGLLTECPMLPPEPWGHLGPCY